MYETPGWGWLHYITSSHIVVNVVEESISVGIKTEFCFKWSLSYPPRTMAMLAKGYGPIRRLMFDGDEAKYDLWEIKFLWIYETSQVARSYPNRRQARWGNAVKNIDALAQLIQCLDDRSLSLVMRDAKDDGREALQILRDHYMGKSKPRVIALYTELTSQQKGHAESITEYVLRAETAAA